MNLQNKVITVFGGTGFIGRYIVAGLARQGAIIKVATRFPQSAYFLRQFGTVGQIVPFDCDYSQLSIDYAVKGSDMVVNCVGILFEKGKSKFKTAHVTVAKEIATACAKYHVQRLVHISALGVTESKAKYAESKREGEQAVRDNFPAATILRPSIVFGPEDHFFNKFAQLAMFLPFLPLIGKATAKFQPVYVGDVADAAIHSLNAPDFGPSSTAGKIYELGGAEILDFKSIYQKLFIQIGRKRFALHMPEPLMRMKAVFLSLLPTPPITGDQITLLKSDNIVSGTALTLRDLGIQPTALDAVLPTYLDHYRPGGRFSGNKERA